MVSLTDVEAFDRAVAVAQKGWGFVSPNPLVGCVVLNKKNELIAEGYHAQYGGPHAEIDAFRKIKNSQDIVGAKVYVTLEPCSHFGKTGPCAQFLSEKPIAEVIYGLKDPNPLVSGRGESILKSSSIQVRSVLKSESQLLQKLENLAEIFLTNMREKRPFVALKVGTSKDGMMSRRASPSRPITSDEAREQAHYLRAGYDAVLVGKNTFLIDNPKLNIRHKDYVSKDNFIVVADSQGLALEKLNESNLFKYHSPEKIFWVVKSAEKHKKYNDLGINFIEGSIEQALPVLFEKGIKSLFVEGGAQVFSYFLHKNLVDRIYHFQTQNNLGEAGLHWLSGLENQVLPCRFLSSEKVTIGPDFLLSSRVDRGQALFSR